jgi:hypothetical protein
MSEVPLVKDLIAGAGGAHLSNERGTLETVRTRTRHIKISQDQNLVLALKYKSSNPLKWCSFRSAADLAQ